MAKLKHLITIVLFLGFSVRAYAQVDSLSYALGFESTIGLLAGENDLMRTEQNFKDFIRGLEENIPSQELLSDTVYWTNYTLGVTSGGMLANFYATLPVRPQAFKCMADGLRRVADGKVSLPADTIGMADRIHSMSDAIATDSIAEWERCRIFTEMGIMYGLDEFSTQHMIDEKGIDVMANQSYFARGMADMLDAVEPVGAYELGRSVGCFNCAMLVSMNIRDFSIPDFVYGAKAALDLDVHLMTREEVERMLESFFGGVIEEEPTPAEVSELLIGDRVYESGKAYDVDWTVSGSVTADMSNTKPEVIAVYERALDRLKGKFGIEEMIPLRFCETARFFREPVVERKELMDYIAALNEEMPAGYRIVCYKSMSDEWTVALVTETDAFSACVDMMTIEVLDALGTCLNFEFRFDKENGDARKWWEFTKRNIGKIVVMEINGTVVMAPMVNSEITSGACSVMVSSAEEAERLLGL